jgi:hypothetical protein
VNYISDLKSATRIKTGYLTFVFQSVLWTSRPVLTENEIPCHLLYPRFQGNQKTVSQTATFARLMSSNTHLKTLYIIHKSAISFEMWHTVRSSLYLRNQNHGTLRIMHKWILMTKKCKQMIWIIIQHMYCHSQ